MPIRSVLTRQPDSRSSAAQSIVLALLLLVLIGCGNTAETDPFEAARDDLHGAFEAHFELSLERNPLLATFLGDHRYNDRLAITIAPDYRTESLAIERRFEEQVAAVDPDRLGPDDRLSREMFLRERRHAIEGYQFPSHLLPVDQFRNFGNTFAQLGSGAGAQPFETAAHYRDFIARMGDFSAWLDQAIDNMRQGMETGVVQPRILMERLVEQLEAKVVAEPEDSVFWQPLEQLSEIVDEETAGRIREQYREALEATVIPAYARLARFITDEYLEAARDTHGMHDLPDGNLWYEWLVRGTTTTDLAPAAIHDIGLAEIERIHGEIRGVMADTGFEGSLDDFFEFTSSDEQFFVDEPDQLLEAYEALRERVEPRLGELFDLTPEATYEIRPVEPYRERSAAGASYMRPAADGSRPGIFYVNTFDLSSRPLWQVESLFLHEAVPGHHFQIALQQEQDDLPRFRRFGGNTAFIEGWALYAESLGPELGLYDDPYQYFGMLNGELWRAIRLVVDTGLHHYGWSREEVLDFMFDNSSVGRTRAVAESERYMAIPSQALAYKIGQLTFERLRTEAEERLEERFDLQAFHDLILENGPLPLDLLEEEIELWIAEQSVGI